MLASSAQSGSPAQRPPAQEEKPSEMLGRFWTIPNVLSLLRLAVVVPITYLIWIDGSLQWLFGLIVFGALTDFLDGRVARWSHAVSGWGKVLDPLADKFAAVMVISALTFRGVAPTLPLWFFLLVIGRDLCILAGGTLIARRTGQVVMSGALGKAAVASLALTALAAVLRADAEVLSFCVWLTTALLVGSFLIYLGRYFWLERTGDLPKRAQRESEPLREEERGSVGVRERGGEETRTSSSNGAVRAQEKEKKRPEASRSEKQAAIENGVPRPS